MAKAKEGRTIPCGEFERKISLGGFGRSKFREWNKMAEIFACREKGPWPSTPLDTSGGPASRWHNTRPPFGLIKGIAWHEMQLFLHATTHTSYPSVRFTAMAGYTARVSVRRGPYVA